ncbi:MAG: hypothetical protein PHD76_06580 [Methylacidiphilales bacterium]|nr:hypothetical protein [Candidatus Methylacidiphilales bacterium]
MRVILSVLILMVLAITATANPASVRIAIISDADEQNLSALLTTELSGNPNILLLERDELAKVADELKLQQMAGKDAVALGKLVGADGLLFISKTPDGLQVRFTAVGLGYALFDDPSPPKDNLPELAKSIAHRVTGYAPKLKLDPTKAIPISVLNLRADYATTDSAVLERKLTLLLESRLASLPDYVVLERRHAWSLGFEHSLSPTPQPLLQGVCVIDGTLSLPTQGTGDVAIHLRLRSPNNQQTPLEIHGPMNNLHGLTEQMVVEIQKATGTTANSQPWQPQKEAREYLLEGIWGWQHKVSDAALEALDSADLLGERAQQLFAVRSEVCGAISGNDLKIENERIILPDGPSAQHADQRAAMIIRSIQDAVRFYESSKTPGYVPDPEVVKAVTSPDPGPVIVPVASYILALLDREDPAQSDRVREALRVLTKFDPAHGSMGPYHSLGHLTMRNLFIEEWPATLDEQFATLRVVCSNSNDWLPSMMLEQGKDFCPRFLKTTNDQKKQFDLFVKSLKTPPVAHLRLLLIQSASGDPAVADAAYKDYLGELWNQRETIAQENGYPPDLSCARGLPDEVRRRNAAVGLPLLHYVLAHSDSFHPYEIVITILWKPAGWSRDEASSIWKEYQAFKARAGGNVSGTFRRDYEAPFKRQFPDLAVETPLPSPEADALTVTRYWYPWRYASVAPGYYYENILTMDDESIWLSHNKPGGPDELMRVFLPDFKTQSIPLPANRNPHSFVRTSDALYTTWETNGHDGKGGPAAHQIARYDPQTATWAAHALPDFFSGDLYGAGNALYLFVSFKFASNENAIMRYDWDHDSTTLLSSTRRKPAQNQFDDNTRLYYAHIFLGLGGKPCMTTKEGTFYMQETPGPWQPVFDSSFGGQIATACGKTIVTNQRGEIVLLDPQSTEPKPLMTPVQPIFRKQPTPGSQPIKELPSWFAQAAWDATPNEVLYHTELAFHEDTLFALKKPKIKGGVYDLLCYRLGQGRTPRHIPLVFHLNDQARADLCVKPSDAPALWAPGQFEHPDTTIYPSNGIQFFGTKDGLCIEPFNVGFWFLPYSDIDGYLKAHTADKPQSNTTMDHENPPSDKHPRGDVIDPTNLTDFR